MSAELRSRAELNAWIEQMRARGWWATPCWAGCGEWFAQDRHRKGRRAETCTKKRCLYARKWWLMHGRAAPQAMLDRWRKLCGDERVSHNRRQSPDRRRLAA